MNLHQNENLLMMAIKANDIVTIGELINQGTDVNYFDRHDIFTPLMQAIHQSEIEIVRFLLEAGADIHSSTYFEDTPLGLAISKGNLKIILLLLQAGADPNNGGLQSPLYLAISIEDFEITRILIDSGADVNSKTESHITPLMAAATRGNLHLVKLLVNSGANVDTTDDINGIGVTALVKAADNGHKEVFDYLFALTSSHEQREYAQQQLRKGLIRKNTIKGLPPC